MIHSITVTNYQGESIKMELGKPEASGFAVYAIDGLGPVTGTVNMTDLATGDGSLFNSARVGPRNIVMTLGLLFARTVEEVRHLSYRYFPVKRPLALSIETDERVCEIKGYVEANEIAIFSDEEAAQISILCPDPYFREGGEQGRTEVPFAANSPEFEFPFENAIASTSGLPASYADYPGTIQFGVMTDDYTKVVFYDGDVDAGVQMVIDVTGPVTGTISIINDDTEELMVLDTAKLAAIAGGALELGDSIEISTVRGSKSLMLLRNGIRTNILGCLGANSQWLTLRKGDNFLRYTATTGELYLSFRMSYDTLYEGV